jgi:glucoamylase
MIAGIGTPWGETQGDGNTGGYHLVWSRDLFKFANALITAGDTATPATVVHYLFDRQQQKTDCGTAEYDADGCAQGFSRVGRFPQNSWVSGWPYWQGTQMDEQAMPILLAWRLGPGVYNALWPKIALTADYILRTGPWRRTRAIRHRRSPLRSRASLPLRASPKTMATTRAQAATLLPPTIGNRT